MSVRIEVNGAVSSGRDFPDILQFSSEDQMTKWQICQAFADIMGLPLDGIEPFTPDEDPKDGTVRPYDCHLDTSTLQQLGIDISTVDFRTWWYVYPRRRRAQLI
jgi:S-adenosylmethionine synthetase